MKAFCRFIYNLKIAYRHSMTEYMKQCHFLPVKARVNFKICLMVFKCLNGLAPRYLDERLTPKSSLESLRIAKDKYLLEKPALDKTNYKNRRFSVVAPQIWNCLPYSIRSITSVDIFTSELKAHLYNEYFVQYTHCKVIFQFLQKLLFVYIIVLHILYCFIDLYILCFAASVCYYILSMLNKLTATKP